MPYREAFLFVADYAGNFNRCAEDRDAALKNFQDQAKEAKINIKKIKRIKFLEFDSGRMHATGYFEVEYEGDEFPEDF
jgi:hypothetical protein